ncbi:MAG: hypothetical protein KBD83_04570 [Gammaproteobacteria bacterium]|nr:hypothetical protein [Gammaproteobacteria bacterium]
MAALFGMNSYRSTIRGEQQEYAPPQAFLQKRIWGNLSNLASEGVAENQAYVRDTIKSNILDFLEQYELDRLEPNTRDSLELMCKRAGLESIDAVVLEQQRQRNDRLPKFGYNPSRTS